VPGEKGFLVLVVGGAVGVVDGVVLCGADGLMVGLALLLTHGLVLRAALLHSVPAWLLLCQTACWIWPKLRGDGFPRPRKVRERQGNQKRRSIQRGRYVKEQSSGQ
jgi:hypothetical protein